MKPILNLGAANVFEDADGFLYLSMGREKVPLSVLYQALICDEARNGPTGAARKT